MGLLTDPSAEPSKFTKLLTTFNTKINIILYIGGLIGFVLLAHPAISYRNYFSENALLPGLVQSEFRDDSSAKLYYQELLDEMKKYDNSMPYPWILAKFRQMGLEVYVHNFTLNYPLKKSQRYQGKNVYAILRAPRAASTESLVLSVPYRPPLSFFPTTAPSIAIMMAFAKFAAKGNYWSKDLIFLITDHEQLGVQAWIEAYYGIVCGKDGVLDHGDLEARAGAIQAAINLELHDYNINNIDVKILGLNGQLPNLDLFNLANKLCSKEKIPYTFKGKTNKFDFQRDPNSYWKQAFQTMMSMIVSQISGVPDGNHGLFHRVGIQALTLEGFSAERGTKTDFLVLGKLVEHTFRSLNNLLERLHQSYFFYILSDSMRFVSIGVYTPVLCTMAATLILKAAGIWFTEIIKEYEKFKKKEDNFRKNKMKGTNRDIYEQVSLEQSKQEKVDHIAIGKVLILAHTFGLLALASPNYILDISSRFGLDYSTEMTIYVGFCLISGLLLFFPLVDAKCRKNSSTMKTMDMIVSLELGAVIICLLIINVAVGVVLILFWVPAALFINPSAKGVYSLFQKMIWLLLHPLIVITVSIGVYVMITFPGEGFDETLGRSFQSVQQAIVYSIIDSMVYGNWLFNISLGVFFPIWLLYWHLTFTKANCDVLEITEQKKVA